MAIKDLQKILKQVHEPNEFKMVPHDTSHPTYWIWKLENVKMKDLDIKFRSFRKEHARFDIFINGQYILEKDYIQEHVNNDLHIKFKRVNFGFQIESDDEIKVEGDIELI
tara:strand:- start:760 stop:1089 length:330 start_codon:yes stop_codon:yes gene_type:complete